MDLSETKEDLWTYCEKRDALRKLYSEKPELFNNPWESGDPNKIVDGLPEIPTSTITDIMSRYSVDGVPLRGVKLPDGREGFMRITQI